MKHRILFLLLLLTGLRLSGQAQTLPIQVRQSFESTEKQKQPAAFVLTIPATKSASILLDGGIAYAFETGNRLYIRPVVEYHRNTLIDKEQNNGQLGITTEAYLRPLTGERTNWILNDALKLVRDWVSPSGSLLATGEISPFSRDFRDGNGYQFKINRPFFLRQSARSIRALVSPAVGVEYQNVFSAPTAAEDSLTGQILRGMGKLSGKLIFNKRDSSNPDGIPLFNLSVDGALRYDLVNQTRTPAGWHPYLRASADYIILTTAASQFSVGLSFVTGENPAQGLAWQKYGLLALKFTL